MLSVLSVPSCSKSVFTCPSVVQESANKIIHTSNFIFLPKIFLPFHPPPLDANLYTVFVSFVFFCAPPFRCTSGPFRAFPNLKYIFHLLHSAFCNLYSNRFLGAPASSPAPSKFRVQFKVQRSVFNALFPNWRDMPPASAI